MTSQEPRSLQSRRPKTNESDESKPQGSGALYLEQEQKRVVRLHPPTNGCRNPSKLVSQKSTMNQIEEGDN
jgi:hypothetical protein